MVSGTRFLSSALVIALVVVVVALFALVTAAAAVDLNSIVVAVVVVYKISDCRLKPSFCPSVVTLLIPIILL